MPLNLQEPESAGRLNPRDILGHLLLVWAVDYIPHSPTKFSREGKPSDVIVVDVVDLDLDDPLTNQPGFVTRGCWWRPSRLIQALKGRVGDKDPVCAWMSTGTSSQGMNAPYVLASAVADPEAVRRVREWEARTPGFMPSAPPAQQAAVPEPREERQVSELERQARERLGRIAQAGVDRLPQPPAGEIPF